MDDLSVTSNLILAGRDLNWRAVRASGPGGQNVNKVATKVELCFELDDSVDLSDTVKTRLRRIGARYLNADGQLVITVQTARSQRQNLDLACEALIALVRQALVVPKTRRKTKPTRASKAARAREKVHQSKKKQGRNRVTDDS
jgi:ribosome-associated protein